MKVLMRNLFLVSLFLLAGCQEEHVELTRVDVEELKKDETYENVSMLTNKKEVEYIENIFKQIKWDEYSIPSMAEKENLQITFFYKFDENMPEQLVDYKVWFDKDGDATILSNDESEIFGELNKENSDSLKEFIEDIK